MKNCISIYEKFMLLRFIGLIVFIISGVKEIFLYTIFAFMIMYLASLIRCQKCNYQLGITKNGYATPFSDSICVKCGQDLDSCTVESDEITNKRLEKK